MAPRGRKRKAGLMREDAARDRMRDLGFQERVISESIKEVLQVYGEDQWFLIEDESYAPLLSICLEKQEEQNQQLAENQNEEMAEDQNNEIAEEEHPNQLAENQNEEMAEDQNNEIAEEEHPNQLAGEEQANQLAEEQEEEMEQEQDMHVEELSVTSEAVMDPSQAAFHLGEASVGYALHPVEGVEHLKCGWLSGSEEETDPEEEEKTEPEEEEKETKEDSDGDDDEMIQLTPEPLCEELQELVRQVRERERRKKETRWDK